MTRHGLWPGWQFWIDRGGTFTDVVARRRTAVSYAQTALGGSRAVPDAAVQGIRDLLGLPAARRCPRSASTP